jgi:hypothetical protein
MYRVGDLDELETLLLGLAETQEKTEYGKAIAAHLQLRVNTAKCFLLVSNVDEEGRDLSALSNLLTPVLSPGKTNLLTIIEKTYSNVSKKSKEYAKTFFDITIGRTLHHNLQLKYTDQMSMEDTLQFFEKLYEQFSLFEDLKEQFTYAY